MIRAPWGDEQYWNGRETKDLQWIERTSKILLEPSANPIYRAQFAFDFAKDNLRAAIRVYSRGGDVAEMPTYFPGILDAWEISNRTSDEICAENNLQTCRDWTFELTNLNHYIWCFWLVSLALVLEIPDDQWLRLVALIGEGGQDVLLDRVVASRQPERPIGENLLHAKPYARLLKAIDAPQAQQATLLLAFVKHWYPELNRRGKQQPWWYIYGDPVKHPLEMGSYFGRWCFEAVAAVKVFGLDDSDCIGHEHYPGDLLHPGEEAVPTPGPVAKPGWWARLLGRSG
ncbi:PoNe immunity protein domain-containing protein [Pseudomonas frederiksbergensis]|uniref:Membrane protein n=1 Tax=Pseudomonas frederiksbergensis TaxID=104087 RepID=A0A0B1Z342_9PSED|nr:PoNe immunity protein domain-containing protein [Pseudomonas frederiksbergensis]KHK63832.1 membrane protein [Pseudomonas frederiksbergensis]